MDEVKAMAQRFLNREAKAQSLQATALVLTALRRQKLNDQDWSEVSWQDRERFLAAMYRAMDRALKDHGRRRAAKKRKTRSWVALENLSPNELLRLADFQPHDLGTTLAEQPEVISALTDALAVLECRHPDWAAIARHRYYGGLSIEQTSSLLGMSERTIRRHWEKARVLLHRQILCSLRENRE
jgi:DNA-directed RNA polymerase specialized sigma24 family protein